MLIRMICEWRQLCMCAGVCFYQRESLPGYSAIFKHPNEELNFCYCAPLPPAH